MNAAEKRVRELVREGILTEWTFIEALYMRPEGIIPALVGLVKDMFAPTTAERLIETGDDKVIEEYQRFLGTLHMTPEYKAVWENYKQAQRRHASMDSDFDRARDIRHPVGRAFSKLKSRVMMKFDELEETLSPENRDIWEADVEQQRQVFRKIFEDWSRGKITTGRVLGMLDPKGIVEGKRKSGARLTENGEMFWGRDYAQMKTSQMLNDLEVAEMDLDEIGCPTNSHARTVIDQTMKNIEKTRERPDYEVSMMVPLVNMTIRAISECDELPEGMQAEAKRIASELAMALDSSQETARF